jgi:DNA-binding GntR family transcriptional regulator
MGAQADLVEEDIIRRIESRQLMPGEKISDQELRERLNTSGTPVREAFLRLEARGIVERRSSGGAFVVQSDLAGMLELAEALAEAEGAAAYRAARRINQTQIDKLEKALVSCETTDTRKTPYYDCNLKFHLAIAEAAGNRYLLELIQNLGCRLVAYMAVRLDLKDQIARSNADHRLLFEAITSGEADRSRELMMQHITMSDGVALDVMNRLNAPV